MSNAQKDEISFFGWRTVIEEFSSLSLLMRKIGPNKNEIRVSWLKTSSFSSMNKTTFMKISLNNALMTNPDKLSSERKNFGICICRSSRCASHFAFLFNHRRFWWRHQGTTLSVLNQYVVRSRVSSKRQSVTQESNLDPTWSIKWKQFRSSIVSFHFLIHLLIYSLSHRYMKSSIWCSFRLNVSKRHFVFRSEQQMKMNFCFVIGSISSSSSPVRRSVERLLLHDGTRCCVVSANSTIWLDFLFWFERKVNYCRLTLWS